jgi:hypothetical protein
VRCDADLTIDRLSASILRFPRHKIDRRPPIPGPGGTDMDRAATLTEQTRGERVVLDATLMVTPAADAGLAMQLGPGRLHVTARLADDAVKAPTVLIFRADRNSDPAAHIEMPVSAAGEAATVDLVGGVYGIRLHVNAPTPDNATLADVAHVAQFVELAITHASR